MSLNSLSRILYRASRTSRDLKALSTGSSRRIVRRAKNKAVGRVLARTGSGAHSGNDREESACREQPEEDAAAADG
jgi:hypothetical protein